MKRTLFTTALLFSSFMILSSCGSRQENTSKIAIEGENLQGSEIQSEMPTEIGIQLWSVRDAMSEDPAGTLAEIGEMGYDYVETAGYSDGKIYGMEPEEFKVLVEKSGLKARGAHSGMAIPESGDWKSLLPWWETCIATHKAAGAEYIVQPFMGGTGYESLEGLDAYCQLFNAVGAMCNEAGLAFGYHNHDGEFAELEGEVIYDYLLEHTDADKVFFQLDVYWIYTGNSDPFSYFENFPGRFKSLHVKHEKELTAEDPIDYTEVFKKIDQAGAEYLVVEVERYNFEPMVSIQKSLEYLKTIL